MSRSDNPTPPLTLDPQVDENRIRRALGLQVGTTHQQRPEQARQRHRFVSDGAVPVVMLNRSDNDTSGLKERVAAAEHALESERAAHAGARRALHEAQAANQVMQTRLGHAELAHNEAIAAERQARRAAEEALAEARGAAALVVAPAPELGVEVEPKRRGRKPAAESNLLRIPRTLREQKPVRWWTPSYRAKQT